MKLSVYIAASLDGFIARENGALDWLSQPVPEDPGEDYGYGKFMDSVDVLVMGRYTYETILSFGKWPYQGKRVIVLSNRKIIFPERVGELVEQRKGPPVELAKELRKEGVNHVYIDGGKTIQAFLKAGLINEIIISRIPILIGQGIPLFGTLDHDIGLKHLDTRSFPNSIVQSRYQVVM